MMRYGPASPQRAGRNQIHPVLRWGGNQIQSQRNQLADDGHRQNLADLLRRSQVNPHGGSFSSYDGDEPLEWDCRVEIGRVIHFDLDLTQR